jgi:1,4-dihydroxy-2-naphthoate polyprenyltransferase
MQGGVCSMKSLRLFIQLSRPIFILSAVLLYILGVGIAHYLSGLINWTSFFLGLAWIVFILLGTQYLNEYFDPMVMREDPTWKHTPFSGGSGAIGAGRLSRQVALWAGLTCLTITASLTVLLIQNLEINLAGILILGLIFLGEFLYAIPPFRLVSTGYGELVMSIIMVGLVPAMAFLWQGHDFHRLLVMVAFPLTTLHIGMLLALEFPDYASDIKQGKRPVIVRIGWQRGMIIHNLLILVSFVILGIAFVFGLPLRVGWPVIFVLPIGLFQIWMMNRIADGAKPNWNLLVLVSISTFGLTTYLLTFAFWTH